MPYLTIEDFRYGVDRRRKRVVGIPGTLWSATNAVIGRGGDIERAKMMAPVYPNTSTNVLGLAPSSTVGATILAKASTSLNFFENQALVIAALNGRQASLAEGQLETILDYCIHDEQVFAIGQYDNGEIACFYDGTQVTDIHTVADNNSTLTTTARRLAQMINTSNDFTAYNDGADVYVRGKLDDDYSYSSAAGEVLHENCTATVTITGGSASAGVNMVTQITYTAYDQSTVNLMSSNVDWTTDNDTTAEAVKTEINTGTGTHSVTATRSGAVITLTLADVPYNKTITVTEAGDVTTTNTDFTNGTIDEGISSSVVEAYTADEDEVRGTVEFTIDGGTENAGTNKITGITYTDGAASATILTADVDWTASHEQTAEKVAVAIMAEFSSHGWLATVDGAKVILHFNIDGEDGDSFDGSTPSTSNLTVSVAGDVTVTKSIPSPNPDATAPSYGRPKITKHTLSGSADALDQFTITLSGTAYKTTVRASSMPTSCYADFDRVFGTAADLILYCKFNDPTDWTDGTATTGAGNFRVYQFATKIERYGSRAAIFGPNKISLYTLDTDPANFSRDEVLENTGTVAPRSVVPYGNNDVFYLDRRGIRSLRARDGYNEAFADDIGLAIDSVISNLVDTSNDEVIARARGLINPEDGRYWLSIGTKVYVFTTYLGSGIRAWTDFSFSADSDILDMAAAYGRVHVLTSDRVYIYGGFDGDLYPYADKYMDTDGDGVGSSTSIPGSQIVTVETPFLSAEDPAGRKVITGFDIACTGTWTVEILTDPNDETVKETIGTFNGSTYSEPLIVQHGFTSQVAFKLTCSHAGNASVSMMSLHYKKVRGDSG